MGIVSYLVNSLFLCVLKLLYVFLFLSHFSFHPVSYHSIRDILLTMSEAPRTLLGAILKFPTELISEISIENVSRDQREYVDFEKMIALDGIALINILAMEASVTLEFGAAKWDHA